MKAIDNSVVLVQPKNIYTGSPYSNIDLIQEKLDQSRSILDEIAKSQKNKEPSLFFTYCILCLISILFSSFVYNSENFYHFDNVCISLRATSNTLIFMSIFLSIPKLIKNNKKFKQLDHIRKEIDTLFGQDKK